MKKILAGLITVSLLALTDIYAQNHVATWKNDQTYSVNNYKHPNKAAVAKKTLPQHVIHIVNEPASAHHSSRIVMPNRRIVATDKTGNGKEKTPLAVRRRASEKLLDLVLEPETNEQKSED